MHRFRNSLLLLTFFAASTFAQTAEELEAPAVNRVAEKLLCSCGCKMNMACRMEPYPCRMCWENKKKILKLQTAGLSDQAILDQFAKENGKDVVSVPPGKLGTLSMYSAAFLGLILVVWAMRRYSRPSLVAGGAASNDTAFDRYHEQIEKEAEKLD